MATSNYTKAGLNCGDRFCKCCREFEIMYYKSGSKYSDSARLFRNMGYSIMSKKAANMPAALMASVVLP